MFNTTSVGLRNSAFSRPVKPGFASQTDLAFRENPIEGQEAGVRTEDYGSAVVYYGKKTASAYGKDSPYGDYIAFKKPLTLAEAMKTLYQLKTEGSTFTIPYEIQSLKAFELAARDPRLQNKTVNHVIGIGSAGLSLELDNGRILKLLIKDHFGHRGHVPNLDLPVYEQIRASVQVPERRGRSSPYTVYAYEQAQGDTSNLTPADMKQVLDKIQRAGLQPHDIDMTRMDQIARFNGEAYLLDPECAMFSRRSGAILNL